MLSDVSAETDAGSGAAGMAWGDSVQNPTRWHIHVTDQKEYPHFGPLPHAKLVVDIVSAMLASLANFLIRIE